MLRELKKMYGDVERVTIPTRNLSDFLDWPDLIKMDVEGHEANLMKIISEDNFNKFDIVLEIGSIENRNKIFKHLYSMQVNMFSQKLGWTKVEQCADLPSHYTEGSLFVSKKEVMPWP